MEEVANPMETLMSWGFEMQAFYFNAIEILGRPRPLDLERVFFVKDARCHPRLVASIDKEYVFSGDCCIDFFHKNTGIFADPDG